MVAFFKALGMGLLYVVTLPLTLIALAIGVVYCFVLLLVLSVKSLVLFFSGRTIFRDLEEDLLADKIYAANLATTAPVPESSSAISTSSEENEESANV